MFPFRLSKHIAPKMAIEGKNVLQKTFTKLDFVLVQKQYKDDEKNAKIAIFWVQKLLKIDFSTLNYDLATSFITLST